MNSKILNILSKLEDQANLENSGKVEVSHEDQMLAITSDTGKFFKHISKNYQSKKNVRNWNIHWLFYIMVCRCTH